MTKSLHPNPSSHHHKKSRRHHQSKIRSVKHFFLRICGIRKHDIETQSSNMHSSAHLTNLAPSSSTSSPSSSPHPPPSSYPHNSDFYTTNSRHNSLSRSLSDRVPTLKAVNKRSPFGALLTRTLPKYHGLYEVGVCDIELPVGDGRRGTFGNFRHKNLPDKGVGLTVETVLWTMFYPTERSKQWMRPVWFPNFRQTVDGFLRMASVAPNGFYRAVSYPIAAMACYGTTFPAHEEAPLMRKEDGGKWPVVIFSHGVGCSRLMYSAICGELASRGYVVIAIEHRDGTGPSSSIRAADGSTSVLDFLSWRDISWPETSPQPSDANPLRKEQLKVRLTEIYEAILSMGRIARGENVETYSIVSPHWDWEVWKGAIDVDEEVFMVGHSFGGTAAIAAAADARFKFKKVVAYDPAIERLEPWNSKIDVPLLVINSEEFAVGMDDDFPRLLKVVQSARDYLIFNIAGSNHPSFSDVHLILPAFVNRRLRLSASPEHIIELTVQGTQDFFSDRNDLLIRKAKRGRRSKDGEVVLKRPIGKPGQWLIYQVGHSLRELEPIQPAVETPLPTPFPTPFPTSKILSQADKVI